MRWKVSFNIIWLLAATAGAVHAQKAETLESLTTRINQLQTQVAAQQAQISALSQKSQSNDSTLVSILTQWVTGLEAWKGTHFLHHMIWQNGNVVKYAAMPAPKRSDALGMRGDTIHSLPNTRGK